MTITFVAHLTPEPALYGALAAMLAELRALPLLHLPVSHDEERFPGGRQHITAQGQRVSSGLLWVERLTGRDAGAETPWERVRERALNEDLVVPVNPALLPRLEEMMADAGAHGVAVVCLRVVKKNQRYQLEEWESGKVRSNGWMQDEVGRWTVGSVAQPVMRSGQTLRVALAGAAHQHHDANPAMMAALGDAADALAMPVELLFLSPGVSHSQRARLLRSADGIVLPDAFSPETEAIGTEAADWALEQNVPIFGVGSGMPAMVAALAQQCFAAPMPCTLPLAAPRLGNHRITVQPHSALAAAAGSALTLRFHQHHRLNPALLEDLAAAGLQVAATLDNHECAAVTLTDHPFFTGVAGRPELASRRERPQPLLMAFLQQVRQSARSRAISHAALTTSAPPAHPHFLRG
ncbi:glutamine amidotransferase [Chimaeribacter arupi]|uniref:glutamine amidotransferase-related protein n=1 Tax=Chimaeribacter arupi TaxID=2060066 RepID=UPI0027120A22|nr:glutamine amidotransferase [Chimaeribacter arupi]WKZ91647.1 glutamine amidotransferase [Chimaeribacter arupi]